MIGFIFIGTFLGWIAAGAALLWGFGALLALGACALVGSMATLVLAVLCAYACPARQDLPA